MAGRSQLILRGLQGMLANEGYSIGLGQSVVIGRSRHCDLSTRRSSKFLRAPDHTQRRVLGNRGFLKVSRRHVRISFLAKDKVEIWDLSQNGTFVNGERVDRLLVTDLATKPVEIRLAKSELLRLELANGN